MKASNFIYPWCMFRTIQALLTCKLTTPLWLWSLQVAPCISPPVHYVGKSSSHPIALSLFMHWLPAQTFSWWKTSSPLVKKSRRSQSPSTARSPSLLWTWIIRLNLENTLIYQYFLPLGLLYQNICMILMKRINLLLHSLHIEFCFLFKLNFNHLSISYLWMLYFIFQQVNCIFTLHLVRQNLGYPFHHLSYINIYSKVVCFVFYASFRFMIKNIDKMWFSYNLLNYYIFGCN